MLNTSSPEFAEYGSVLEGDFTELLKYLGKTTVPKVGNLYVRDEDAMHSVPGFGKIQEAVFGNSPIEGGYCNGNNRMLNCMEFHSCPEVDVAVTDLILLLARPCDVHDEILNSKDVRAFEVKAGEAVVLYPYVLHFSPCMKNGQPFRCGIFLTQGTNQDLKKKPSYPLLWKENKWLFAHKDTVQAKSGAYIGIEGENIEIL